MNIHKKRSDTTTEDTNIDQKDILETTDSSKIEESENIEAGLIDDLKKKLSGKGEGGFFKSLLQSKRRIDTNSENKYKGNIVYQIDFVLLDDEGEDIVRIPAELRLEQATSTTTDEDGDEVTEATGNINMYLKLPDKNYSENKKLNDVDTSGDAYRDIPNSKEQVGIKCWRLFNELEYSKDDDFLKQFATEKVNPDEVDFDSKQVKTITFLNPDPETGEEKEYKFKAIIEVSNPERTKVNISFIYPKPSSVDDPESNWLENEDEYTDVSNTDDRIFDCIESFCVSKYDVSPEDWSPNKLTASQEPDEESIMSTKTMRVKLQKVKASKGYGIELSAINATYDPSEVMNDVDLLLVDLDPDEDFAESDTVTYDVTTFDDGLEYECVESDDDSLVYIKCGIDTILNLEYLLYFNCKHMMYAACGKDMNTIQCNADSYCWRAQSQIDTLEKLLVEYGVDIINPIVRIQGLDNACCCNLNEVRLEDFKEISEKIIVELVYALNLYICNLPMDVHPVIEEMIRSWSYELNYILKRSVM